ncbi:hypothetical protein DIURU_005492 [Diutina rugosa]|uniref:Peptidase A1 domain-containing protein n=1 Tax=Diutina rugosa TaxID=5481 RepID=A0A642UK58_DIURU|nr:uncharacterized protein DIURU_005492 [Diutina rugosa]KAA8896979.1 hypothetical protein DIURU_005492 [Diutina rugosa]
MVFFLYPFMVSLAAALVVRDQAPKPLSYTLEQHPKKELVQTFAPTSKRDGSQSSKLFVDRGEFVINLGIIDKDQKLGFAFDTGSSDLWVDASKLKNKNGFTKNGQEFDIFYSDSSYVKGEYGTSSVWLENGVEVKDLQWALANEVEIGGYEYGGILGVGKEDLEASYKHNNVSYPNFTQKLKDDGLIGSNSYSYFLNKTNATTGSVVFGGRDLAKVKGPVATITPNTTDVDSQYDSVTVSKFTDDNGGEAPELEVVLDTGTTLSYVPFDTIDALKVPGVSIDVNHYVITCDQPDDKYVSFWFGDVQIKASYNDLAVREYDDDGKFTGRCLFGIQGKQWPDPQTLGQTFLRNAYITVNHDENQVLISDVNYTDEENIVAI